MCHWLDYFFNGFYGFLKDYKAEVPSQNSLNLNSVGR